ncbi:uncharacterized protein LOC108627455 isoform X2 [Ceratina calcarata]|uniref:Uncharacterized protein LOC108627455 isoform X2 n=1 Tax=Ceratina calcarata TaxID=156304 RepID=A0AAJ7J4F3_9HYME|nr:uncharacterized protein LOC108627455 isoform X2 [Ceratina calcarata]
MIYSALQEYQEILARHKLFDETDELIMDDINSIDSIIDDGSVVSNLPLLFADGHPTSLEKITMTQLERFVTFMVQCSLVDQDTSEGISKPQWWPKEIQFSNPLIRPRRPNESWMTNLKKLVFRCYTYHRSEYLLRFCSYLAKYPKEDLEYVNNWDSTTSLYQKNTGKLLVTFRNENMDYDKRYENMRKKLLGCSGVISASRKSWQQQRSIMMVQPPTEDIYLCDNCDAEFVGVDKMKEHERVCYVQTHVGDTSRSTTPDVSAVEPDLKQDNFLEYFRLRSTTKSEPESKTEPKLVEIVKDPISTDSIKQQRSSRRVRGSINFARCPTIPFSSPAGLLLAKNSKAMTEETQQERLERIERHLIAPVLTSTSKPKWLETEMDNSRWIVTYREKDPNNYVHQYQFINSVKRKPMLSIQSQLLYVVCRPVSVLLSRVTSEELNDLQRDSLKHRCLVENVDNKESVTKEKEQKPRPNFSLKRKAPNDESDNVIGAENGKERDRPCTRNQRKRSH